MSISFSKNSRLNDQSLWKGKIEKKTSEMRGTEDMKCGYECEVIVVFDRHGGTAYHIQVSDEKVLDIMNVKSPLFVGGEIYNPYHPKNHTTMLYQTNMPLIQHQHQKTCH